MFGHYAECDSGKTDFVIILQILKELDFESPFAFLHGLGPTLCVIEEDRGRSKCLWVCVKNLSRMASNNLFAVGSFYSNLRFLID